MVGFRADALLKHIFLQNPINSRLKVWCAVVIKHILFLTLKFIWQRFYTSWYFSCPILLWKCGKKPCGKDYKRKNEETLPCFAVVNIHFCHIVIQMLKRKLTMHEKCDQPNTSKLPEVIKFYNSTKGRVWLCHLFY